MPVKKPTKAETEKARKEQLEAVRRGIATREYILAQMIESFAYAQRVPTEVGRDWSNAGFGFYAENRPSETPLNFNYSRDFHNSTMPQVLHYSGLVVCVVYHYPKPEVLINKNIKHNSKAYAVVKQIEKLMYYRFSDMKFGEMSEGDLENTNNDDDDEQEEDGEW